jgi:hypothetical protein
VSDGHRLSWCPARRLDPRLIPDRHVPSPTEELLPRTWKESHPCRARRARPRPNPTSAAPTCGAVAAVPRGRDRTVPRPARACATHGSTRQAPTPTHRRGHLQRPDRHRQPGHGSAFGQACSWTPRLWGPAAARRRAHRRGGQGCASALGEGGPTLPHHPNTGGRSLHVQNDPRGDRPVPELLAGCAKRIGRRGSSGWPWTAPGRTTSAWRQESDAAREGPRSDGG